MMHAAFRSATLGASEMPRLRLHPNPALSAVTALALALISLAVDPTFAATAEVGLQQRVIFTEYTPLSGNLELVRRSLTPLTAAQLPQRLKQLGKGLSEQPVSLADERYTLYVPSQAPPQGYALLVFVPRWRDAHMPQGWTMVLDRFG